MNDLQQLIRQAVHQGWSVEQRRGGHLCWRPPGRGAQVFSASSPSDWRNLANLKASLRRAGLNVHGGQPHD
jgi:hypothetical protein